jgi:signal transduction histidine kinase
VQIPDFLRTSTFRMAGSFATIFAISAAALFAFVYWQTAVHETARIDHFLVDDAEIIARETRANMLQSVSLRITRDLHRITYAALFDQRGVRIAGNLAAIPSDLPIDGKAHAVASFTTTDGDNLAEAIRAVGLRALGGNVLIIGRNAESLQLLRDTVLRALGLGVIPAMILALFAGAFVSWRAQKRVKAVHRATERIMRGDLHERLPTRGTNDDFDRLANSVNRMLDEIGRLLDNVKKAGSDIAHDLRTPLARLRIRLERGKEGAQSREELRALVASAIVDLDQTLSVITTVLRIGEIEAGRRRIGFTDFDLGDLAEEVAQIYEPIAEEKGVALQVSATPALHIRGDRALMLEALANLVQNAIKFTPAGGHVAIVTATSERGPTMRVIDDGPGIPQHERVFERFHRVDKSRGLDGSGLGLSLVAAIAKFHRFHVDLADAAPGCIFEIVCRPQSISESTGAEPSH